jgi:ABC-type lipoprotein export system ATPase subunit
MTGTFTGNRKNTDPAEPGRALVEAQNVGRTYPGYKPVVALASATCAVLPGERVAITGPSGSGKSTLLYLLAGLETPTSGTVTWPALGPRDSLRPSRIAFVFQMPSLLPPLTAVENVELPLLLNHVDVKTTRQVALAALEQVKLSNIAESLPEELSSGQAQRVAVARALAFRPRLILADEPTGELDHPTGQYLFDVLLNALEGMNTALVVATHDPAVAERMHKIWHIHYGILETDTKC